jgi:putative NADH-flavin reductase
MERLLILGGTGPTGRLLVQEALTRGHPVTALARRPDRLALQHPRLRLIACDVAADPAGLRRAVAEQDIVISTLGRGLSLRSHHVIERAMASLVPILEEQGPRRIVLLSAFGVGSTSASAPRFLRLVFATLLSGIYADKAKGEAILRRSALEWTILHAVLLIDGNPTGRYEIGEDLPPAGVRKIRRADVATALLANALDPLTIRRELSVRS